jgi:UDP-GlcNAc:undecaprenyl-phosphate GlcNAc-1-phosphate transferase
VGLIGVVLLLHDGAANAFRSMQRPLAVLFAAATFIFLVGLVDDLRGLPAKVKLAAELLAAGGLCLAGIRIDAVTIADGMVLHLGGWGCVLTVFWVVGITNAVNLSDGLDGLAAGVSAVTCAIMAVLAIHCGDEVLAVLMLALVGGLSGFLVFNFNPARIFMGDSGSLFLGFVISASSVLCAAKSAALVGLTLPALALGIPIFDTLFSILRRFLERRSLFAPDRSHFHHHLLDLGLQQRHAVIMIYLATGVAGSLGLFMLARNDLGSVAIFVCLMFLIVLLFRVTGVVRLKEVVLRLRQKHVHSRRERRERRTFEQLQLEFRQVDSEPEKWQAIREAARRLDLAWVSVQGTDRDGRVNTIIWREPGTPRECTRIVTVSLPIRDTASGRIVQFEVAVPVNGSLESANHRVGLFSRLLDESSADGSQGVSDGAPVEERTVPPRVATG